MTQLKTRLTGPQAAPPWTLAGVLRTVVTALVTIFIGSAIAISLSAEDDPARSLLGWTLGAVLMAVLVVATYRRNPPDWAALRLGPSRSPLLLVFIVSLLAALALDLVGLLVSATSELGGAALNQPEILDLYRHNDDSSVRILAIIFMLLAQPIGEELVFRGVALPSFRSVLGAGEGLVASAVLYAIFHFIAYPPPVQDFAVLWYALALPALTGLVIGAIRVYTDSTSAAILAHSAFGLFIVAKILFTV